MRYFVIMALYFLLSGLLQTEHLKINITSNRGCLRMKSKTHLAEKQWGMFWPMVVSTFTVRICQIKIYAYSKVPSWSLLHISIFSCSQRVHREAIILLGHQKRLSHHRSLRYWRAFSHHPTTFLISGLSLKCVIQSNDYWCFIHAAHHNWLI